MKKVENLPWLTQKPGSVDCGAVAILNAKLWLGEKVNAAQIKRLARELGISHTKDGVSGTDLNRWIRKKTNFGVEREVRPTARKIKAYLDKGYGIILRYLWEVEDRKGGHFVFIAKGSKSRYVIANPHRRAGQKGYQKWRFLTPKEFKEICARKQFGVKTYPWIWPISGDS